MSDTAIVSVHLFGKKFEIATEADQVAELEETLQFLKQRLQSVHDSKRNSSLEKTAVITAINLAHELLQRPNQPTIHNETKLIELIDKVDHAISEPAQTKEEPQQTTLEISTLELAQE